MSSPIVNSKAARQFMFAGNAVFTLVSNKTSTRYTFNVKISKPKREGDKPVFFVSLLTGPNNKDDYTYLGYVPAAGAQLKLSSKSRMQANSGPVAGFMWMLNNLYRGGISKAVQVWHEGRCGRCCRPLTVPSSIATGLGPDCAEQMGITMCEPVAAEVPWARTAAQLPQARDTMQRLAASIRVPELGPIGFNRR